MKSLAAGPLGVQLPRVRHAPTVRANAWEDVADLAAAYGLVLDPWQENVLQASMGERSDGKWATPRVGISVPRQNGKGALIEARELAGLLLFGEREIIHSAHEQKTARVGFERLLSYFENYDDLRKRVKQVMSALTREYIQLTTGQVIRFPARSKGALRGFSPHCLILDEAQELGDPAIDAIQPAISAQANPQTWMLGTPPSPLNDSAVFTRMRQAGLEGKDGRLAWLEWSAAAGADLDDVQAWAQSNPSLGADRPDGTGIRLEAIQDEREALSDDGFARERLGMWGEAGSGRVIGADLWAGIADVHSWASENIALAVDVSPARDRASVAVAGQRPDGLWHVELDEQHDGSPDWIPAYLERRLESGKVRAVIVDVGSPAASLVDELKKRRIHVTSPTVKDVAGATGRFYDGVMEQWLRHTDQPQVNAALGAARKRPLGDAWAWNRKNAASDITPLVACTLALWGAQSSTVRRPTSNAGGRRVVVLS